MFSINVTVPVGQGDPVVIAPPVATSECSVILQLHCTYSTYAYTLHTVYPEIIEACIFHG